MMKPLLDARATFKFMAVSAAMIVAAGLLGGLLPSNVGNLVKGLFIIGITFVGYVFPSIIAWHRDHHQKVAILLLNLLLGWTVLGWIGALIWAATATKENAR
jgi:hypothetical protein